MHADNIPNESLEITSDLQAAGVRLHSNPHLKICLVFAPGPDCDARGEGVLRWDGLHLPS